MQLTAEERFRAALTAALPWFGDGDRLGLAVSGGGDSLGMLALAAQVFPGRCHVLTVDHQFREGSAADAAAAVRASEMLGVPAVIRTLDWPDGAPAANQQAEAREARYDAMAAACADLGIRALATGHQLDDQAETLLMRLGRGSGVSGLSGIRPSRPWGAVTLVRPCLGFRRVELRSLAEDAGLSPLDDPANTDPLHDRTAVRALLAETNLLEVEALAESAAHLGDAEAALLWLAQEALRSRCTLSDGTWRCDLTGLPAETVRRTLTLVFADLGKPQPRGRALSALIAALRDGKTATLSGVRGHGGAVWTLSPEDPG